MESLIDVINKLHDAFADAKMNTEIKLPQIAVVGSQSSGKSSVLEAIVGKDFLPRGSGIVTRCPLVLQLVQLPNTNDDKEWGEFLHKPGQKYTDFSEIHKEILSRTEEIAGKTSITSTPINLKVYSRHVLNLTLVDLPGLVVNAVGDQPKDIDRQIKNMVTEYVSHENTIILAVSPANADIATSASLQLAKEIDPEGVRTVGVMTKLDLMDKGTDAMNVLNGGLVPLRHGFVGVVNRSQQDINDGKGMQASRDDEMTFLNNHKAYSAIAEQHGTGFLTKKLSQLLLEHIMTVIPDLRKDIDKLIVQTNAEMEDLGMLSHDDSDSRGNMYFHIKLFNDAINNSIDGCETDGTKNLVGGARLECVFHDCFAKRLDILKAADVLTDEYVRIESRNLMGMNSTMLFSDKVFVSFAKKQIARLEEPSKNCVTHIHDELVKIVQHCALKLDRFPKLRQSVSTLCRDMLEEYKQSAQLHVQTVIRSEGSFVNAKHPRIEKLRQHALITMCNGTRQPESLSTGFGSFGRTNNSCPEVFSLQQSREVAKQNAVFHKTTDIPSKVTLEGQMALQEQKTNDTTREMVEEYFKIVKESIADHIPKAIHYLMISKLREDVYTTLITKIVNSENPETLMAERPEIAEKRKDTTRRMDALKKAKRVLGSVEDCTLQTRVM